MDFFLHSFQRFACVTEVFKILQLTPVQAQAYLANLVEKQAICPDCVYKPFTGVLLDFYQHHGQTEGALRRILSALSDAVMSGCATSVNVEKLHASVQVQTATNKKGRRAGIVQRESYIMAARNAHSKLQEQIEQEIMGDGRHRARRLMGFRVISQSSAASASLRDRTKRLQGGRQLKHVCKDVLNIKQSQRKAAATTLWQAFLSSTKRKLNLHKESLQSEYRAILACPHQRANLQQLADTMAQERLKLASSTLGESVDSQSLSKSQQQRMGHSQLDVSLQAVSDHVAWSRGLGLQDCNSALAASLVQDDLSAEKAQEKSNHFFGYNPTIVQNQSPMPVPAQTCCELFGGLCAHERFQSEAKWGGYDLRLVLQYF